MPKQRHIFHTVWRWGRAFICDTLVLLVACLMMVFSFDTSVLDPSYWLDYFSKNHNQMTAKTLYEIYNYNNPPNDELKELLTLVDVKDMTSRSKLASLIDTVYSLEPQAIAVDFMFHSPQDSVADKTLVETVRRVRDKTVFAYMLEDYQAGSQSFANAKHSFFLDPKRPEWYCDSVMEGYANMKNDGTSEPVWLYSVVEKEGNKNVCSLPAMLLGEDLFVDSIPHQEYVINYKGMDVNIISPDEITLDHIKDHMVMIGAYEYSGDKFDTPLGMLPGMMVHTYIIQSLTGDSIVEQSPTDELLMTAISLLLLMMAMLLTDVLVEFLITKVHLNFFATVLEGIFSSVVMGILAVILLKAYSYHLLMDENVFMHGQAAFNGILIAAAILKVLYAATIQSLCRNKCLPKLTHYSIYSKFQSSQ